MITVRDLIEALKKLPSDAPVVDVNMLGVEDSGISDWTFIVGYDDHDQPTLLLSYLYEDLPGIFRYEPLAEWKHEK